MTNFKKVNPKQSFPELEEEILKFWKENKIFEESITSRSEDNPYRFYDGPPFITGTPHYGSLLSSICKDVVPRYHTMNGKRCERVWGWDCHGIPIEDKVQKELGLHSNKEIEDNGIDKFIEGCYRYTTNTSAEWEWYIDHIGRWVDFKNSYKTMDRDYMESTLWVFKTLYDKGLIYKGQRTSLYSWKLSTPISNFEIAMDDSYEEVSDPAITVMFKVEEKKSTGIIVKNKKGEILMGKKKSNGLLTLAGGKLEGCETIEKCAIRELEEETGIKVDKLDLFSYNFDITDKQMWRSYIYELTVGDDFKIQNPESHKFDDWKFYDINDELLNENNLELHSYACLQQLKGETVIYKEHYDTYLLAWTTTPWTIPAHMAIAVNEKLAYSRVKSEGKYFILATARVETVFKGKEYEIIESFTGENLVGLKYKAPFSYYQGEFDAEKNHIVYNADFVTDSDGTGIAHEAPEFGDVDFELAKEKGIHISNALDNEGKYTSEIEDLKGTHYIDANEIITNRLKDAGLLFKKESINHRVAMCPRTGTPLIYKVQDSWFIDIQNLKDKLIKENEGINWSPTHLKHGQFLKSMEAAPDWCISRTRYWGTPMPIWIGYDESGEEKDIKIFGSIKEIENASNMKVDDLHRPYIDKISWKENGLTYKRIPEVLDCWVESGSMPYAQDHYPFENKEKMEKAFPADFIVEYIGQVRAWFYVMHVLGVALFDTRSFTNVITTGIVNGTDGRKMSKSYKNYPDPKETILKYGADAIRFYMVNSPLLSGGNLSFNETQVQEVIKKVILPLWNTYSFFTTYANIDNYKSNDGNIYFCRHGQSENNLVQLKNGGDVMMNGGDNESLLTETGKKQAKEAGFKFNFSKEKIDVIISSPRIRAKDTAKIIAKEIGYTSEIIVDERLNEIREGVFLNMTHSQIREYAKKEYDLDLKPGHETRKFFKDGKYNKVEDIVDFDKRVIDSYKDIEKKYKGKNVLIVAHTGVFRPINKYINNIDFEIAHYGLPSIQNSTIFKMPKSRNNVLDKWIISELNKLILDIKAGFDNYKINDATRPILSFMDNLTNWYIRRSRKRFWADGMELDKKEAYDTLYEVLVELSKILAPLMPFISEYIYKNLTGKKSVHLDSFPNVNKGFILNDLNDSFLKTSKLVNLGLAFRQRHKIRVRQVLKSVTIGEKLEDYYLEILKEELNVKEVIVLEDPSKIAKKICRPNAKLIGPKYGKDVQKIIIEAKNGNFDEIEDGKIKVGEFILEQNEYEIAYEKSDEDMDIEAGFGMVIAMDSELTPELIQEGQARDLVRYIQESRKEASFEVSDRIFISIKGQGKRENGDDVEKEIDLILEKFKNYIEDETLSTIVENISEPNYEKSFDIEGNNVLIKLKK